MCAARCRAPVLNFLCPVTTTWRAAQCAKAKGWQHYDTHACGQCRTRAQPENAQLRCRVSALQAENDGLRSEFSAQLEELRSQLSAQRAENEELRSQFSARRAENEELPSQFSAQLEELRSQLSAQRAENEELRSQLSAQRAGAGVEILPSRLQVDFNVALGSGATCSVYKGLLRVGASRKEVAVKVFRADAGGVRGLRSQINRELACLAHASAHCGGITKVFGTCLQQPPQGGAGQALCIVMRLYPSSVGKVCREGGMTEARAFRYAATLCSTLEQLHGIGIVHRDLKPDNLLLTESDELVVADFGVSKLIEETQAATTTMGAGSLVGTAQYMSPEAFRLQGAGRMTDRSDMWSFGGCLLCMLTTRAPFHGMSVHQILAQLVQKVPPQLPTGLSEQVLVLLRKCFTWESAGRPSASDALISLYELCSVDCLRCGDTFPCTSTAGLQCAGSSACNPPPPHFMCMGCAAEYVKTCCGDGTAQMLKTNGQGGESREGCVPCPLFGSGCSDGELDQPALLMAVAQEEAARGAMLAMLGRVEVEKYREAEQRRLEAASAQRENDQVEFARLAVMEALHEGLTVPCPGCGLQCQKDDACMHMECTCGVHFCYVCGVDRYPGFRRRVRADQKVPCGCDAPSFFIESHPGWGNHHRDERGENAAQGALIEFHRQRCARFVRVVKQKIDSRAWAGLMELFPRVLDDVWEGRGISWDEIDDAEHPQLGRGRARELLERLERELLGRLNLLK